MRSGFEAIEDTIAKDKRRESTNAVEAVQVVNSIFAIHHSMYAPQCGVCGHVAVTFLKPRYAASEDCHSFLRYLKMTKDYGITYDGSAS